MPGEKQDRSEGAGAERVQYGAQRDAPGLGLDVFDRVDYDLDRPNEGGRGGTL